MDEDEFEYDNDFELESEGGCDCDGGCDSGLEIVIDLDFASSFCVWYSEGIG